MLNRINNFRINMNINYKLTRGGVKKPYKIRNYKEFRIISIDEISSNR